MADPAKPTVEGDGLEEDVVAEIIAKNFADADAGAPAPEPQHGGHAPKKAKKATAGPKEPKEPVKEDRRPSQAGSATSANLRAPHRGWQAHRSKRAA